MSIQPGVSTTQDESEVRRVAGASLIGTALEWYDYFLYGVVAALLFDELFFPKLDPTVGTIAALLTFAIGFVARPIGAIVFGHFGDRYGRKATLIVTVIVMGVATGLIGLLPSYESIGLAAPILLAVLRFAQGTSVGGEWGGAVLLAIEHAPPKRRAFYGALPQLGSPAGTLLSSAAFALVQLLPDAALHAWGWRLPFLVAFLLLAVALYLRLRVEESPLFAQVVQEERREKLPLARLLRADWPRMIVGVATCLFAAGAFFLVTTYMINYGTDQVGLSSGTMLTGTLVGAVIEAVLIVISGRIADQVGPWRVCSVGSGLAVVLAFPVFWLVDTANPGLAVLGVAIGVGVLGIPYGPLGQLLAQLFPDQTRYTAVAVSFNIAGMIGGFMPALAATMLANSDGSSWGVATLLGGICLVSTIGAAVAGRVLAVRRHV